MDLVSYYTKHGPLKAPRTGAKSGTSTAKDVLQNGCANEGSASTAPAAPVRASHPAHNSDKAASSDNVEEDDSREIPTEELVTFVRQLRSFCTSSAGKERALEFNKTNPAECARCIKQNIECRHSQTTLRCDCCSVIHQSCSRTNVFYIWMVRLTFKLSWAKAEEALERGQALVNSSGSASASGARSSARASVARVRKPPATVTDGTPVLVAKRPELSGAPRADRKRRTVSAPESKPEPSKRRKVLEPELGREILPPPPSPSEPAARKAKHVVGRDAKQAVSDTSLGAPAILAARVTATEERLAAIEARLQIPLERATRLNIVTELGRAIVELEIGGDVQGAIQRLRTLHASLLDGEHPE